MESSPNESEVVFRKRLWGRRGRQRSFGFTFSAFFLSFPGPKGPTTVSILKTTKIREATKKGIEIDPLLLNTKDFEGDLISISFLFVGFKRIFKGITTEKV